MVTKRNYFTVGLIALGLAGGNALAADDAKSQLMAMATKLAEAKQFSVSMRMGYDAVQKDGQQIEFGEIRKTLINRPNHLRIDTRQSDGDTGGLIFDGITMTLFSTSDNVYSITDQPGTVDAAIRFAVGKLGMRVPLARMLLTSFPQELEKLSSNIEYVEENTLGATPTDHLAGRTYDVDYQMWISNDDLPARIVLTYKNEPGQPEFWAEFSDWNMAPKFSDATFVFTPPEGAEKILTLLPAPKPEEMNKMLGGAK